MSESFLIYVDESGDEGFKFASGSSERFVLSAVVVRVQNDHLLRSALAAIRTKLGKRDNFPLHFRDLKHEQRIPYVQALAGLPIRTVTILVNKPCLKEPETFRGYRLYHYCVRFLLERVSWLCRDEYQKAHGDGSAKVVFSNRSAMSYTDLTEYVDKLVNTHNPLDVRIEPSVIKTKQIIALPHKNYAGLQAADAVASSFYFAANTHHLGFTEPRYVEYLSRSIYRNAGEAIGYGVKFWPKEADEVIKTNDNLKWSQTLLIKK